MSENTQINDTLTNVPTKNEKFESTRTRFNRDGFLSTINLN